MTHDPKAVLALAQSLQSFVTVFPWDSLSKERQAYWLWRAADALDAITPIIVAAEREACAQLVEAKKKADPSHEDDGWRDFDSGWNNCAKTIFDAIRARKP